MIAKNHLYPRFLHYNNLKKERVPLLFAIITIAMNIKVLHSL